MSRRRARLHREMQSLAETLQGLGPQSSPDLEDRRQQAIDTIKRFFLPRLEEDPLPLVVALIGSTGAGKSTILNSLAGRPVSRVGVVRPTTRDPIVWSTARHAERLSWMGTVTADDHPLARSVALVDTPDLDSDLVEHRQRALEIADASDAIVMVTTAARYGDARPWEALRSLPDRPLIIVLNRVATRSSGARNFLVSQLRNLLYEDAGVVTISEQETDRLGDKLPHQSVRRLLQLMTIWTHSPGKIRTATFDRLADRTAADVNALLTDVKARRIARHSLDEIAETNHRQVAGELATQLRPTKRRRWRRVVATDAVGSIPLLQEALDRAAAASYVEAGERGIDLPASMRTAAPTAKKGIKGWAVLPADLTNLEVILTSAGSAWTAQVPSPSEDQVDHLAMGLEMLTDLEWPGD